MVAIKSSIPELTNLLLQITQKFLPAILSIIAGPVTSGKFPSITLPLCLSPDVERVVAEATTMKMHLINGEHRQCWLSLDVNFNFLRDIFLLLIPASIIS